MLKIFIYTILFVTVSYSAQGTSDEDDTLAKNLQSISTSGVNEEELNLRNVPIIDANFDTEPLQSFSTIGVQEEELNLRNVPIIDTNFSTEDTPDTSAKNLQSISTSGVNEEDVNPIKPIIKTRISLLRRRGNKPLTINTPTTPTGIPDDELIRPIIITNSPLQIKRPRKGLSGATTKKKEISLPLKLNLPNVPIIDTNFDTEPSHNILQSLLAKKLQSISTIGVKEEEDTPDTSAKNLQSISTSGVNEEDVNPIKPIIKTRISLLRRRGNKPLTINTPTTPTGIPDDELIRPIIITNSPLQIKRPRKGLSGATTKKKEISLPLKLNLPNVPIIDTNFDTEPSHNILQSLLAKKLQSISTIGVKEEDDNPIQPIIKTRIPLLRRRGNKLLTINTPTTPTDITEDTPDTSAPKNTPSSWITRKMHDNCEIKKIENQ